MLRLRATEDARGWPVSASLVVLVLGPLTAAVALSPGSQDGPWVPGVSGLLSQAWVLAAGGLVYFHWRLAGVDVAGWLSVAMVATAFPGLVVAGLLATGATLRHPGWTLLGELGVTLVLLGLSLATWRPLATDPILIGIALGSALALGVLVCVRVLPAAFGPLPVRPLQASVFLAVLVTGTVFAVRSRLPRWGRVGVGFALLIAGQAVAATSAPGTHAAVAAPVATLGGGMLLCSVAWSLVWLGVRQRRRDLVRLRTHLELVEQAEREHRARLHEIGSSVAGLAAASMLIRDGAGLPQGRRSRLEQLVQTEVARLERLIRGESSAGRDFDLDEVLAPLVVRQAASGLRVTWESRGIRAHGRPDDVAGIVAVLLDNVAHHASFADVFVTARSEGDRVVITVTDTGPGVAPEVMERLFTWGARGPDSAGQGIGLHVARRLAEDQGGALTLDAQAGGGATFVLALPIAVGDHDGGLEESMDVAHGLC